ncbi:hypothetical protein ACFV2I_36535 [Streptomyces microflavus]|uniref:hypothetical protein n=1 Tax=Streptomyces microflavus TaxID=1919 RepID=UPI0036B6073F
MAAFTSLEWSEVATQFAGKAVSERLRKWENRSLLLAGSVGPKRSLKEGREVVFIEKAGNRPGHVDRGPVPSGLTAISLRTKPLTQQISEFVRVVHDFPGIHSDSKAITVRLKRATRRRHLKHKKARRPLRSLRRDVEPSVVRQARSPKRPG